MSTARPARSPFRRAGNEVAFGRAPGEAGVVPRDIEVERRARAADASDCSIRCPRAGSAVSLRSCRRRRRTEAPNRVSTTTAPASSADRGMLRCACPTPQPATSHQGRHLTSRVPGLGIDRDRGPAGVVAVKTLAAIDEVFGLGPRPEDETELWATRCRSSTIARVRRHAARDVEPIAIVARAPPRTGTSALHFVSFSA